MYTHIHMHAYTHTHTHTHTRTHTHTHTHTYVCTYMYTNSLTSLTGCVMLASSLKENKHMAVTLSTLNLSGNNFGPDCQGALSFLAEPNAVATLKLARCGIAFEVVR